MRTSGSLAAISSAEGSGQGAFTLFVPDSSPSVAQWEGPQLNAAAAEEVFGANAAFPMTQVRRRCRDIELLPALDHHECCMVQLRITLADIPAVTC